MSEQFVNPNIGTLTFGEVVKEIAREMHRDPRADYDVFVGTDSSTGGDSVDFVRAIVVHKRGKGGRYFWSRQREPKFPSLRHRIWREALLSFDLAQRLLRALSSSTLLQFNLEIHVDIGKNGSTRELINEVVGMIVGSGFDVKIKPDAVAATSVADKYT